MVKSALFGKIRSYKINIQIHSTVCSQWEPMLQFGYCDRTSHPIDRWREIETLWKKLRCYYQRYIVCLHATVIHFRERMRARILRQVTWLGGNARRTLMTCWKNKHGHECNNAVSKRMCECWRVPCTTDPCEWRNIKAFPSDNVHILKLPLCCPYMMRIRSKVNCIAMMRKKIPIFSLFWKCGELCRQAEANCVKHNFQIH